MQNRKASSNSGFALIMNVLLIALVGGLAATLIIEASSETTINANFRGSVQAYYAAKSGLEEARARIPVVSSSPMTLPTTLTQAIYLVRNSSVQPTTSGNAYFDSEYAAEFSGVTPTVTSSTSIQSSSNPYPYQWVRVTLKTEASSGQDVNRDGTLNSTTPVYWDGNGQNLAFSGKPIYKITSLAVLDNGSRSMLQMEGAQPPPFGVNAAIGAQDDIRLLGNFTVSGVDYCSQSSTVYGVYSTQDVNVSGNAGTITGLTGPSPNVTGTYEYAPSAYTINDLINAIRPYATPVRQVDSSISYSASTNTYSGSNVTLGTPPTQPPPPTATGTPVITYASGNLSLSSNNSRGDGILIVDGDLSVNGGLYYYGMIIVRGTVTFTGGGSNATNIYGSIISGSNVTNTSNVGGGVNVQYSSCANGGGFSLLPVNILSFREVPNY